MKLLGVSAVNSLGKSNCTKAFRKSLCALLSATLLSGCVSEISKESALRVVKREAVKKHWQTYKVRQAERSDGQLGTKGNWLIDIDFIPERDGGMRIIEISPQGEIAQVIRGL